MAPAIVRELASSRGRFVEPFVGGFHLVPEVQPIEGGLCSDAHPGLAVLYRAVAHGWTAPLGLGRDEWEALRAARDWENPLTTFAAFGCSYGGREFQGYAAANARGYLTGDSTARRLTRARPWLQRCSFRTCDYREVDVPPGSVVYCDPPYATGKPYAGMPVFDREAFVRWCEETSRRGTVLVSDFEGNLPAHWEIVWSRARIRELGPRVRKVEVLAKVRFP